MQQQPISLDTVMSEIDKLLDRLHGLEVESTEEYRRTRAVMTLEGVKDILRAATLAPEDAFMFFIQMDMPGD